MAVKPGYDVIIVGGGASGLTAAAACGGKGLKVLVAERMDRPGLKLLATGGGRCNLTNNLSIEEIMAAFGRQGRFMKPALERLGPQALRELFARRGVATVVREDGCVFPETDSAATVLDALLGMRDPDRSRLMTGAAVTGLLTANGRACGVAVNGSDYHSRAVILAAGGRSYPGLGGSSSGFELARTLGHTIIPACAALAPLKTAENWPADLAGVSLEQVEIRLDHPAMRKQRSRGALIFTHEGISGPAALNISGATARLLAKDCPLGLTINFSPGENAAGWLERIELWRRESGALRMVSLLRRSFPRAIAAQLCLLAGIDPEADQAGRLKRGLAEELARTITSLRLNVTGTAGFGRAMVTSGGVSLKEVDPECLESRLVQGLYFCGEILDLDGPCGGYNLQWAFASGQMAGECCAAALRNR